MPTSVVPVIASLWPLPPTSLRCAACVSRKGSEKERICAAVVLLLGTECCVLYAIYFDAEQSNKSCMLCCNHRLGGFARVFFAFLPPFPSFPFSLQRIFECAPTTGTAGKLSPQTKGQHTDHITNCNMAGWKAAVAVALLVCLSLSAVDAASKQKKKAVVTHKVKN